MQRKLTQVEAGGGSLPNAPELCTASKLRVRIGFWKKNWKPTLEQAREAAAGIARRDNLAATQEDIDDAANLYIFTRGIRDCDLALCEPLAQHAFETMRDDPTHTLVHRDWVQLLVHSHRAEDADAAALAYLEYMSGWNGADVRTQNALGLWARLLRASRAALPKSVAFFSANFSPADLDDDGQPGTHAT
ncbi:MAG TPA: hypothetical protein VGU23_07725 [Acidobacteriaceae bacterium]|nr:hypothetical protein [Acidobacteriaceae bacterium]